MGTKKSTSRKSANIAQTTEEATAGKLLTFEKMIEKIKTLGETPSADPGSKSPRLLFPQGISYIEIHLGGKSGVNLEKGIEGNPEIRLVIAGPEGRQQCERRVDGEG